jgi:hypothetical protein
MAAPQNQFLINNTIVEENVVDLSAANPIRFGPGAINSTTRFFANQDSAGGLIQGWDGVKSANVPELSTTVDDASALAML